MCVCGGGGGGGGRGSGGENIEPPRSNIDGDDSAVADKFYCSQNAPDTVAADVFLLRKQPRHGCSCLSLIVPELPSHRCS